MKLQKFLRFKMYSYTKIVLSTLFTTVILCSFYLIFTHLLLNNTITYLFFKEHYVLTIIYNNIFLLNL